MTQLPMPVHVGSEPPEHWDDIEARQQQYGDDAAPYLRDKQRPSIARPDIDWGALGFEPRWVGFDAADCAAALQPSIFSGQGADEFNRFRQGAERRGETALVISPIGETEGASRNVHNVFDPPVSSVSIGQTYTSIDGRTIGKGARVRAASDLDDADGQLALRLLSATQAPTWRSLSLSGAVLESVYGREDHPPEGTLLPILETELGEPVVAVWISPDGVERRYVVPVETSWTLLLPWLLEQALPAFVPGAMRRARRPLTSDRDLMTRRERDAHAALADLELDYAARRIELERQIEDAQDAAVATREGLLYGTGQQLVSAVRAVFETAGIEVVDLDEKLGDTKNADLLCTYGGLSRLVEVKSANGSAPERAYQDLIRHLREWPSLPGASPIDGGALVISHDLRKVPLDRRPTPYARPEFLLAQTEPVISALELFAAWRDEDVEAIRQLLFGSSAAPVGNSAGQAGAAVVDVDAASSSRILRHWFGRR
ncbi:hypothetical protein [Propionibacterium freudenreichii]|uniref:hypothetical protein n=1 Tax=Propionibacterium freudenreichii TaxID=1744 RepID=UPI0005433D5F|nr:hypothetical protein [Propionibacterium freudenreichii]AJQ92005.1 Hypothetical protein RM25_2302 [Propionibacterium freudenreichii subsp. freudenreichii]MDK9342751.1 hypothetical protein [Propionibacterium freudenreichii]CEG91137.1 Putative uncharacterized protein [Propionibacterium freudenreichii]